VLNLFDRFSTFWCVLCLSHHLPFVWWVQIFLPFVDDEFKFWVSIGFLFFTFCGFDWHLPGSCFNPAHRHPKDHQWSLKCLSPPCPRHREGTSTAMIRQGAPQAGASQCLCQIFVHGHKWQCSSTFFPFELFGVDQIYVPKTPLQNGHTDSPYIQMFNGFRIGVVLLVIEQRTTPCILVWFLLVDGEEVILLPNEGS
jgi:hypothetical protein